MADFYPSDINPIRYYEVAPTIPAAYQSKHMDDFPFQQTIAAYQAPADWYQPWLLADTIRQQIVSGVGPVTLKVIKDGEVILIENFEQKQQDAYRPGTYIYEHALPLAAFEEGIYYLQLQVGPTLMQSEPMIFAETLDCESLLLSFRNNTYFCSIVFETGFAPSIRIPGTLRYDKPGAKVTSYEDQVLNATTLDARHYRTWLLHVGGSFGIPDYFIDQIDSITGCSELSIDGRLYSRPQDAKWEEHEEEGYPMRGWTIELRESLNRSSRVFDGGAVRKQHFIISVVDAAGFGQSGQEIAIQDIE